MTYDIRAHRRGEIEHDVHLIVDGGPGWDDYVRDKVRRLLKEDPGLHGGLVAAIEKQIRPDATKAARRALDYFNSKRGRTY